MPFCAAHDVADSGLGASAAFGILPPARGTSTSVCVGLGGNALGS